MFFTKGQILVFLTATVLAECHLKCENTYSVETGIFKVNCRRKHLSEVPEDLEPSIQVLDLRDNNITILRNNSLKKYTFLTTLRLEFNPISIIESGAFDHSSIVTLGLSGIIPRNVHLPKLQNLVLLDVRPQYVNMSDIAAMCSLKRVIRRTDLDVGSLYYKWTKEYKIKDETRDLTSYGPAKKMNVDNVIIPGELKELRRKCLISISSNSYFYYKDSTKDRKQSVTDADVVVIPIEDAENTQDDVLVLG